MGTIPHTLSHEEARAYYDRLGRKQDWPCFFEDRATQDLVRHLDLQRARFIVEFGCGTGRFAAGILEHHLTADARYVGYDMSGTMVELSRKRLARFGERAEVRRTNGDRPTDLAPRSMDRFLSNYVVDLLSFDDIRALLKTAEHLLCDGGLLGLASLTHGHTFASRMLERMLSIVYAARPSLLGGCRPIDLLEFVSGPTWSLRYDKCQTVLGVSSEVLVAAPARFR